LFTLRVGLVERLLEVGMGLVVMFGSERPVLGIFPSETIDLPPILVVGPIFL